MKELLAKIRAGNAKSKCKIATEVFAHVQEGLDYIEYHADKADLEMDIAVFDYSLNEMEEVLAELEGLLSGMDSKETKRIKENLEKDYAETLELWKFYELLNPDGKSYTGDYAEYAGKRIAIPTQEETIAKLKPEHLKLYQKMEKEGLEPKLQITPIACSIRNLGKKIDARKKELKINTRPTDVLDDIKDEELQYAPTTIKAVKGGKEIEIKGGKTKSEWIKANGGFLIDIVPTKEALAADDSIQKDQKGQVNYNAIQAEKYTAKAKQEGFTPLSYESYLLAQMRAVKAGKPLEDWNKSSTYSLLLDSNLKNSQILAYGSWNDGRVYLFRGNAGNQYGRLRLRGSVRVL